MKTKNTRLRFKDFFTGRLIYITEPGRPVLYAKIMGKSRNKVGRLGYSFSPRIMSPSELYNGKPFTPIYKESFEKVFGEHCSAIPEGTEMAVLWDYSFDSESVVLQFLNTLNDTPVSILDIMFDPLESKVRVFAKEKQAIAYSKFHPWVDDGQESIFEDYATEIKMTPAEPPTVDFEHSSLETVSLPSTSLLGSEARKAVAADPGHPYGQIFVDAMCDNAEGNTSECENKEQNNG